MEVAISFGVYKEMDRKQKPEPLPVSPPGPLYRRCLPAPPRKRSDGLWAGEENRKGVG